MAREIERLGPWFHNLHLPDGLQTAPDHPLGDFPRRKWEQVAPHLPADLAGARVLDVGCNAGFYTFELAARGASVVAIDKDPRYLRQAAWAAARFGLSGQVELRQQQVYDLARTVERFDVVLFLGVFYHLRYPLLGLDVVSRLSRDLLVFQTLTLPGEEVVEEGEEPTLARRERLLEPGWPRMSFVEHRMAEDPTNWWVPNHAAVEAMLRSSGLRVTARPGHEIYLCRVDREQRSSFWSWNEDEFFRATGGWR